MRGEWVIQTDRSRPETEQFLKQYAPWRSDFVFSNGARSSDFGTFEPFNRHPLIKLRMVEERIPADALSGRILDVGFNYGYNAIEVWQKYKAEAVGVELNPRHKAIADWIASAARVPSGKVEFLVGDAQTYCQAGTFSTVLHFGTLYHLPNPVLSMETAAKNLAAGGWLALETMTYTGPGEEHNLSKFIYGYNGDKTNYWALNDQTVRQLLGIFGLQKIEMIVLAMFKGEFSRAVYVAQKS